jgi:hypothetical protein
MVNIQKIAFMSIVILLIIVAVLTYYGVGLIHIFKTVSYNLNTHSIMVDLPGCMKKKLRVSSNIEIPIFILVRDRLNDLREALNSYKTLSSRWYAIICDHNSTYPPMLKYLADLKESGVEVWYMRNQTWEEALKVMSINISIYLKQRPHLQYYVVTDPDISLNGTAPDLLLFQAAVLTACPSVNVIGPSLQISNLPEYYSKKAIVYKHESQF